MKNNDLFKDVTIPCDTARDFLNNLDLTHPRWRRQNWIFRGQNDARWELVPSLFRNWDMGTDPGLELALIRLFISNANLAQLPIPNDSLGYFSSAHKPTLRQLTTGVSYDFFTCSFCYRPALRRTYQVAGLFTQSIDCCLFCYRVLPICTRVWDWHPTSWPSISGAAPTVIPTVRDVEATIAQLVEKIKQSMDNLPDEVAVLGRTGARTSETLRP